MLPQNTTHLIQRPCYRRESPCQDPAGNWTTRRPPDKRKETQTAVVWSCFPFIGSGQNILQATVKGRRKQLRQRKRWEDNIREWTGLEFDKSQRAVENRKNGEKNTGCKVICGAQTTLAVKGMIMMIVSTRQWLFRVPTSCAWRCQILCLQAVSCQNSIVSSRTQNLCPVLRSTVAHSFHCVLQSFIACLHCFLLFDSHEKCESVS